MSRITEEQAIRYANGYLIAVIHARKNKDLELLSITDRIDTATKQRCNDLDYLVDLGEQVLKALEERGIRA